jgi:hypothetical protein
LINKYAIADICFKSGALPAVFNIDIDVDKKIKISISIRPEQAQRMRAIGEWHLPRLLYIQTSLCRLLKKLGA